MSPTLPIRVVKLGGSVLDQPGYAQALNDWIDRQSPARTLLLVGGGRPVDAIRDLAAKNHYDDHMLHWLCIDLMDASFRLVASQLPKWSLIKDTTELHSWLTTGDRPALVHVHAFYSADESSSPYHLPIGWQTTSDSLAALLALVVSADELVLIKSCDLDQGPVTNWRGLADRGVVDEAFPDIVGQVKQTRLDNLLG